MRILETAITTADSKKTAVALFGDLVKAGVDTERELVAIDAEMHSDLEALLLENGSRQNDLWGVNFYPDLDGPDFLEYDSMINLRPSQGNRSRGVDSAETRQRIVAVADKWIRR